MCLARPVVWLTRSKILCMSRRYECGFMAMAWCIAVVNCGSRWGSEPSKMGMLGSWIMVTVVCWATATLFCGYLERALVKCLVNYLPDGAAQGLSRRGLGFVIEQELREFWVISWISRWGNCGFCGLCGDCDFCGVAPRGLLSVKEVLLLRTGRIWSVCEHVRCVMVCRRQGTTG